MSHKAKTHLQKPILQVHHPYAIILEVRYTHISVLIHKPYPYEHHQQAVKTTTLLFTERVVREGDLVRPSTLAYSGGVPGPIDHLYVTSRIIAGVQVRYSCLHCVVQLVYYRYVRISTAI